MAKIRNRARFLKPRHMPNAMNAPILEHFRMPRGYILTGSQYGFAQKVNADTDGYIFVGDGSDVSSVAVSGDIALTNAGVTTLQPGAVDIAMLATATNLQSTQDFLPAAIHSIPAPSGGDQTDQDAVMGFVCPFNLTLRSIMVAFDTAIAAGNEGNHIEFNVYDSTGAAEMISANVSAEAGVAQYAVITLTCDQNNALDAGDVVVLRADVLDDGASTATDMSAFTGMIVYNYSLR